MSLEGTVSPPRRRKSTARDRVHSATQATPRRTRAASPPAESSPALVIPQPVAVSDSSWFDVGQRLFDVCAALVLLALSSPLWLVIAVVNKLASSSPVFYTQERVGRGGRRFQILKFRSMRVDAERETGPVFAVIDDSRCTRLGGWLRRSCCDELPQLLNVLRGEMSLVGPRPERPHFVEEFCRELPHYDLRHRVRPGITGWAQVSGWRGCTSIAQRLRFDLDYVQRRSLLLDACILLLTPVAIVFPERTRRLDCRGDQFVYSTAASRVGVVRTTAGDGCARAA